MRKNAWAGNGVKVLAGLMMVSAAPAALACCPSGGHTSASMRNGGMGLEVPDAPNVSLSSYWKVYTFERDGLRYIQVNDLHDQVRAVVGFAGGAQWVMPMGSDEETVSIGINTAAQSGEIRTVVYRSAELELASYESASGLRWVLSRVSSP